MIYLGELILQARITEQQDVVNSKYSRMSFYNWELQSKTKNQKRPPFSKDQRMILITWLTHHCPNSQFLHQN